MVKLINTIILLFMLCAVINADKADPSGFVNWFRTNLDEFDDKPLTFTKPIPKWISGSLVRHFV